jgi:hypothetical protein
MDPTIWIAVAVGVLVLAVGGFLLLRRVRRPKEEPVLHFNCPGCRQRLGYRVRQAGHKGQCPRCKRSITFPVAAGKPASPKRS